MLPPWVLARQERRGQNTVHFMWRLKVAMSNPVSTSGNKVTSGESALKQEIDGKEHASTAERRVPWHDTVKWIQGAVRPVVGVEAGSLDMDYLIGLGKATWHPVRCERAKQGGDLWIWDNKFGSFLGVSHPLRLGEVLVEERRMAVALKRALARKK